MDFNFEELSKTLGTNTAQQVLYLTAFTHRSYLNEHPTYDNPSNERLEFLGDAVLQLVSSEFLYNRYPHAPEGILTNYRAAIVCTPSLAEEAKRLGYGQFLLLSHGEQTTGGRDREYILANTFEAVLGAMYLDQGLEICKEFIDRELFYKVDNIIKNEEYKDAKSKFQEIAQEKYSVTPVYKVLDSWGLDHEKTFKIGVYVENDEFGIGTGKSKQKAEQSAARQALDKIQSL